MLRRTPYPELLEPRREIEEPIHELLEIKVIRKIGNNGIGEFTTPVLITCNDGKSRLFGRFSELNNYKNADRYPIPWIPHALDKMGKAKFKTKMDCMKGLHLNGAKPKSIKLLRTKCHIDIY
ncbi:hypothetical protein O181_015246 [Austropuccinia psidii MF-1]|uniref:Uncharacterized protein n=1 Tax=Austropuccinia psidii MF-1 TaxID=1389203 RepID=A0A9Q3BZL9_9BASI|nr:hypothetical protein [Austropuccinia psidii MF-1]